MRPGIGFAAVLLLAVAGSPAPVSAQSGLAAADAFDRAMRGWMAKHGVARGSVAVMRDSRLAFAAGYGGQGANEPVAVWSLSKSITGACIAVLAQEGRLRFDDPIGRHLARLFARHGGVADARLPTITIAQLLTHRGGFPDRFGDNRFAPGVPRLLERMPPGEATASMLMGDIVKLTLAAEPGTSYTYSNVGYLLLGQIVEAATGQRYEEACARRVLIPAGIAAPRLDARWGRLLQATGGWALSGPEYLAYSRILAADRAGPLDGQTHRWMRSAEGRWLNERRINAYTLGILIRVRPQGEPNFFHGGSWLWRGRYAERRGTWFVRRHDGVSWFASFDGVSSLGDSAIIAELQDALWKAAEAATAWPAQDLFPRMGIGPASAR
jgi:CubicO group peptidase (beta-lactamase class C family)